LTEVRWPRNGEIVLENYTMFYSSGVNAERGIAIVSTCYVVKSVTKVECTDRLIFVKIRVKRVDILLSPPAPYFKTLQILSLQFS